MAAFIGIDTSNYRTSVCILENDKYKNTGRLLTVKQGDLGLRQNDALFLHTRALPDIMREVIPKGADIRAIGVSTRPRNAEGSYMPCFLAGVSAAYAMERVCGAVVYETSHQDGHIYAVLYANREKLASVKKFYAVHLSGGTSEILLTDNDEGRLTIKKIGGTLDINAGQLIDRAGVMLGLKFPAGAELEKLISEKDIAAVKPKIAVKGCFFNLSGHENKLTDMNKKGESASITGAYAVKAAVYSLINALKNAMKEYGELPILFAGGVSCNGYLRKEAENTFPDVYFAPSEISGDNALGCAYGAYLDSLRRNNIV